MATPSSDERSSFAHRTTPRAANPVITLGRIDDLLVDVATIRDEALPLLASDPWCRTALARNGITVPSP